MILVFVFSHNFHIFSFFFFLVLMIITEACIQTLYPFNIAGIPSTRLCHTYCSEASWEQRCTNKQKMMKTH